MVNNAAVLERPKPQVNPMEAAIFKAPMVSELARINMSAELKKSRDNAEKWEAQRKKGENGQSVFAEARSTKTGEFNSRTQENLTLRFGGGAAVKEGNQIKIADDTPAEFKGDAEYSLESAQSVNRQVGEVLSYVEIQGEVQKGRALTEVLSERGMLPSQWFDLRQNALEHLNNTSSMRQLLPELKNMSERDRNIFIEATMASDPRLRTIVIEKMKSINENAKNLKDVEEDPELKQEKEKKKAAEVQISEGTDKIIQALEENQLLDDSQALNEELKKLISEGKSTNAVLARLQGRVFGTANFTEGERKSIEQYLQAKAQLAVLDQQATTRIFNDEAKKAHDERYKLVSQIVDRFDERLQTTPNLNSQFERYNKAVELLNPQRDQSGYVGEIAQEVEGMVKAGRELKDAQRKITEKEPAANKKLEQSRAERLRQEAELIRELEAVLSDSVVDLLSERYDEALALEGQRMEKEQGEGKSEAVKKIEKSMSENWIKYNEIDRTKTINPKQIGHDMRFLVYRGEEGVKRLMLRDLGVANYESVDISTLSSDMQAQLEDAYGAHGKDYSDKLFTSYFIARGFTDKTFSVGFGKFKFESPVGDMALKDHEWELLQRHFGERLNENLNSSDKAKKIMQDLKNKGIKTNFSFKWLMWLLLMGAGAAGLVVGGPVALAAGAGLFKEGSGFVRGQLG